MILTGRKLQEIGEALHGPKWRVWLAEKLGRSDKQIRRYEQGDPHMPRKVRKKLAAVIAEQRELLGRFEDEMSA